MDERLELIGQIGGRFTVLSTGSDIEVAQEFFEDCRDHLSSDGELPLVSTGASLYYYDAYKGIWKLIDPIFLSGILHGYDGMCVERRMADGKIRQSKLVLNDNRIKGTIKRILSHREIYDPHAFDEPAIGVVCGDDFIHPSPKGIVKWPLSRAHRHRNRFDFEFDESLRAEVWTDFLKALFRGDEDDVAKINFLQEFIGACLCGIATHQQKAVIFYGGGANGKSVLIDALETIFPPGSVRAVAPQSWGKEYYLSRLSGGLLNAVNEMPDTDILHSEVFKAVIAGNRVTARDPYGLPYDMRPQAGHLFACNSLPAVSDHSDGFWRRFVILGFNRDFRNDPEALSPEALAYDIKCMQREIVTWAIQGAARLMERPDGYQLPQSSGDSIESWRQDANSVAHWFSEDGWQVSAIDDPWTPSHEAYEAYQNYSKASGLRAVSVVKFSKRLESLGVVRHRRRAGTYFGLCRASEH